MPSVSTVAKKTAMVISEASKCSCTVKARSRWAKKSQTAKYSSKRFLDSTTERFVARERYRNLFRGSPYKSNFTFGAKEACFQTTTRMLSSPQTRGLRTATSDDGWQSGCYEKALRVSKTILRGGDSKGNQREVSLRLSPKQKTTLRKLRHGHR